MPVNYILIFFIAILLLYILFREIYVKRIIKKHMDDLKTKNDELHAYNEELMGYNEQLKANQDELEHLYLQLEEKQNELQIEFQKEKTLGEKFTFMLKVASNFSNILKESDDLVFSQLLRTAIKIMGNDYGSVYVIEKNKVRFVDAVGHDVEMLNTLNLDPKIMFNEKNIAKVDNIRNITAPNLSDSKAKDFLTASKPMKSTIVCPLFANDVKVGGMSFDIDETNPTDFTEEDMIIAKSFQELAITFLNIKSNGDKIRNAYLNFAKKLAIIAENHDDFTGEHINRIGVLTEFLAKKMELSEEKVDEIRSFAPLHDIGKIFIPIEILRKPGKLDNDEWEIMKLHTSYSKQILADDEYFKTALNIALYHHEKYDGSGYPFGLKGEEIPIEAQILSIVDVYEALRSMRPYKKPMSHSDALEIIINGDGRTKKEHFNPKILNIFKEYNGEFAKIYNSMEY